MVFEEIEVHRPHTKLAEHGDDLAAMQRRVIRDVEDELPARDGAVRAEDVVVEIGCGLDVAAEAVADGGPDLLKLGEGGALRRIVEEARGAEEMLLRQAVFEHAFEPDTRSA